MTDWMCDLDEADRDKLAGILAIASRELSNAAAVARGEDPPNLKAPYWIIEPGTDERFPDGVRIERIEPVAAHNSLPLHAVAASEHTKALPAILTPQQKQAINKKYPGGAGWLQSRIAQAKVLPAEYTAEPLLTEAEPRLPRRLS